jgi:NADH:ubiquinone oxidoreductase subunit F (NADH-binding)
MSSDITRIALKNAGEITPGDLDEYIGAGGFEAFKTALAMEPESIIDQLMASGLRGRGGAGFPTGLKEKFTSESCRECPERFVVSNADEGEPGTFKDRVIMENDPLIHIEGILISALAINATKGYIYIRGEYGESIQKTVRAIEEARQGGFLGNDILGSGFSFDIELKIGAGSYLCGEELTLIESIEGKRGYPRIKPPYPAEKGLYDYPTLINNVETLSHIPAIIKHGADWYRSLGTEKSPGTKIFCVSGDVATPGYWELEMGITLRELLEGYAGGIENGGEFKSALLGGAAGTFVPPSLLDVPLSYESLEQYNATLGSGAVIVLSENRRVPEILLSILEFFKHESCGKCVPCRVGCRQLLVIMENIAAFPPEQREPLIERLVKEADFMAKTSLCPLGQSPLLPVKSAVDHFKGEF